VNQISGAQKVSEFSWRSQNKSPKEEIRDLAISSDENLVAGVSYHGEGAIFNRRTGEVVPFNIKTWSNGAAFSKNGQRLHLGTRTEKVLTLSATTGQLVNSVDYLEGFSQDCGACIHTFDSGLVLATTPTEAYLIKDGRRVSDMPPGFKGDLFSLDPLSNTAFVLYWEGTGGWGKPVAEVRKIDPALGRSHRLQKFTVPQSYVGYFRSSVISLGFQVVGLGLDGDAIVPGSTFYSRIADIHKLRTDDRGRVLLWDIETGRVFARLRSVQKGREDRTSALRMTINEATGELVVAKGSGFAYSFNLNDVLRDRAVNLNDKEIPLLQAFRSTNGK